MSSILSVLFDGSTTWCGTLASVDASADDVEVASSVMISTVLFAVVEELVSSFPSCIRFVEEEK